MAAYDGKDRSGYDATIGLKLAFVVLSDDAGPVTPEDIIDWSRDQMANYKVPRTVEFVEELPLNATGKVVKETLRQRATARSAGGDR